MADEFGHHHHGAAGNWWDSSPRTVSSSSTGRFGWPADMPSRSSMDSVSVSGSSVVGYHDAAVGKLSDSVADGGGLVDPNLHMMGLGLSSQAMDWNQALLRGEKSDGSFRSMLEENGSFHQETGGMVSPASQVQWRDKVFGEDFKQINRGFSLDQPQFSSHGSSVDSTGSFHADDSGVYGAPSTLLRGLLGSDQQPQPLGGRIMNTNTYQYNVNTPNYGMNNINTNDLSPPSWSKVPQFLRTSPPKQPPLQFSNNAPFWNASADVRSSFFPSLPTQTFEDHKPTKINLSETRGETGGGGAVVANKSNETASKRPRKESPSPLPAFKVRKEKMGDRITALQQLVSPFGKTDTASVLSEAIEYIKFLHDQVNVLSTPYMKSGAPIQHQQSSDKSSKDPEGPKQDLRSRGLCLVPVSSTFPVAHETTVDFWTPTFGGTFR